MADQNGTVIIGFDLGHGETTVSKTYAGKVAPPAVLDLPGASGSGRTHVTAVNDHPGRGVMVGEAAVEVSGGELHLGFKSRALANPQVRRPIDLFARKVREDLVGHGKVTEPPDTIFWVFGAPSGWSAELRENYAELFRNAGFGNVDVVPESRAAMLYARDSGETGVRLDAAQAAGCVVIADLGSSTTDFTIVDGLRDRPTDEGTELGASLIDRAIRDRVLSTHPQRDQLEDAMHFQRSLRLRLELLCRKAKEDFFRLDPAVAASPDTSVIRTARLDTTQGPVYVNVELTKADMDSVLDTPLAELNGLTWREAFHCDLAAVAAKLGAPPDAVLLTGGASRMHFVLDIARQQFGAERVMLGTEPESAIARGLSLAGRINMHAAGFMQDIATLTDGGQIEALVTERLPGFAEKLGAATADGITARHVIPAFRAWRNGQIDTLENVARKIAKDVEAELTAPGNRAISDAFAKWYNDLSPDLEEMTRPICARWHIPAAAMALPSIDLSNRAWKVALTDTSAATELLKNLANIINVVIAGVISTTLFGAGVAIIASTGPFAVIFAAVAAFVALTGGKEWAMEKAKTYPIPQWIRELRSERGLIGKLERDATVKEHELAAELAAQFLTDGGPGLVAEISKSIADQFGAMAEDAKLLVS